MIEIIEIILLQFILLPYPIIDTPLYSLQLYTVSFTSRRTTRVTNVTESRILIEFQFRLLDTNIFVQAIDTSLLE